MAGGTELNRGKLKELILLFVERSVDDPRMSRVKLNKLLYRADFESFRLLGRSMTGATYVRGPHGPMLEDLPRLEEELGRAGRLRYSIDESGPNPRKVPLPYDEEAAHADMRQFSVEELGIIERALDQLKEHGGRGASEWSHEQSSGWQARENMKQIPYASAFVSTEPLSDEQMERAMRRSREEGWATIRP